MKNSMQADARSVGRYAANALGIVLLGAALTRGDGQDVTPKNVHLELRVLATSAGSATYPSGARVGDLAVGESQVWSLVVGLERDQQGHVTGCQHHVYIPAFPLQEVPEDAPHVWEARLTVRSVSVEKIALDVDWKRYVRGSDAGRRLVSEDHRTLDLGEDQRRLLDFVDMRSEPGWESCYSNLALELKASVAEDPALAPRRIAYDLWLVDEGPGGPATTRRWQMAGKQGEARDFEFEPLHRSILTAGSGTDTPGSLDTRVFGQVRGRILGDGSLEVALLAQRQDNPDHRHWSLGGSGAKRIRVGAGETIRLDLPPPAPDMSRQAAGSALKQDADRGVMAVLRERNVSLVLTTRPVQ